MRMTLNMAVFPMDDHGRSGDALAEDTDIFINDHNRQSMAEALGQTLIDCAQGAWAKGYGILDVTVEIRGLP